MRSRACRSTGARCGQPRRFAVVLACWSWLFLSTAAVALECDCAVCSFAPDQPDLLADLDARIRGHLTAGFTPEKVAHLEGGNNILRPPIEVWANAHPAAARPDKKRLKYRGAALPSGSWFNVFEPSVRVNRICMGTDKLAHFFQQGWEYYRIAVLDGKGEKQAARYGEWLEGLAAREEYAADESYFRQQPSGRLVGYGGYGRIICGIISQADLAANRAGLRFYQDLAAGRSRSMASYVSWDWCEEHNSNDYTPAMRRIVEGNRRH